MAEILLTRVDNRLIHGQVATMWTKVLGANLLLVANDAVANDEFKQSLIPSKIKNIPLLYKSLLRESTSQKQRY